MPGEYSEAASRVLTMLEESWQPIRARHPEIPPVVVIIGSGTTGRDARWGRFDSQRWTILARHHFACPPLWRITPIR
jgi:hypothetical protein